MNKESENRTNLGFSILNLGELLSTFSSFQLGKVASILGSNRHTTLDLSEDLSYTQEGSEKTMIDTKNRTSAIERESFELESSHVPRSVT